jgi:hypothetical protein
MPQATFSEEALHPTRSATVWYSTLFSGWRRTYASARVLQGTAEADWTTAARPRERRAELWTEWFQAVERGCTLMVRQICGTSCGSELRKATCSFSNELAAERKVVPRRTGSRIMWHRLIVAAPLVASIATVSGAGACAAREPSGEAQAPPPRPPPAHTQGETQAWHITPAPEPTPAPSASLPGPSTMSWFTQPWTPPVVVDVTGDGIEDPIGLRIRWGDLSTWVVANDVA